MRLCVLIVAAVAAFADGIYVEPVPVEPSGKDGRATLQDVEKSIKGAKAVAGLVKSVTGATQKAVEKAAGDMETFNRGIASSKKTVLANIDGQLEALGGGGGGGGGGGDGGAEEDAPEEESEAAIADDDVKKALQKGLPTLIKYVSLDAKSTLVNKEIRKIISDEAAVQAKEALSGMRESAKKKSSPLTTAQLEILLKGARSELEDFVKKQVAAALENVGTEKPADITEQSERVIQQRREQTRAAFKQIQERIAALKVAADEMQAASDSAKETVSRGKNVHQAPDSGSSLFSLASAWWLVFIAIQVFAFVIGLSFLKSALALRNKKSM